MKEENENLLLEMDRSTEMWYIIYTYFYLELKSVKIGKHEGKRRGKRKEREETKGGGQERRERGSNVPVFLGFCARDLCR